MIGGDTYVGGGNHLGASYCDGMGWGVDELDKKPKIKIKIKILEMGEKYIWYSYRLLANLITNPPIKE